MIDYLQGMLAGRENGLKVQVYSEESRSWRTECLVAVDSVGKVTQRDGALQFTPWHAIHSMRVVEDAA